MFLVRSILCDASLILESLSAVSSTQSWLLAIDPSNPSDQGFLGGSVVGREFWRGLRGGGVPGARAFKAHCATFLSQAEASQNSSNVGKPERHVSIPPAKSIKSELYESVRNALRYEFFCLMVGHTWDWSTSFIDLRAAYAMRK